MLTPVLFLIHGTPCVVFPPEREEHHGEPSLGFAQKWVDQDRDSLWPGLEAMVEQMDLRDEPMDPGALLQWGDGHQRAPDGSEMVDLEV